MRELLAAERFGVLATLSNRRPGWPFGSLVAYALADDGQPLLLLSDLAEHTRNVRTDPRASLLVLDSEAAADPQAGARVTLLGVVATLEAPERADAAKQRFLSRHTDAAEHATLADFRMYQLEVSEARLIAGFGDMGWLSGDRLREALQQQS